jgi:hypothetical protein
MFKKWKLNRRRKKDEKKRQDAETIYMYSHILLVLYNNLMKLQNISVEDKDTLYEKYVTVLANSMTDVNKIMFTRAIIDTNNSIEMLFKKQRESNEVQIQRQLQQIFNESGK